MDDSQLHTEGQECIDRHGNVPDKACDYKGLHARGVPHRRETGFVRRHGRAGVEERDGGRRNMC